MYNCLFYLNVLFSYKQWHPYCDIILASCVHDNFMFEVFLYGSLPVYVIYTFHNFQVSHSCKRLLFWLPCISKVSLCYGESVRPFSTNHLSYTKTLVPIYRFRATTFFDGAAIFGGKKHVMSCFWEILIVAPLFLDICKDTIGAWINNNNNKIVWDILF